MAKALLLDLSRLASRLGKGPLTGIDRVEQAYLTEILRRPVAAFGLVRSSIGFLLLDRKGLIALRDQRVDLSCADLASRIAWRKDPKRARAETGLRRLAIARSTRSRLHKMLRANVPEGCHYFNVGHANLDEVTLAQLSQVVRSTVVLIHDTIPLDHPEFCRADTIKGFTRKIAAVSQHADLVIHTTQDARQRTEAHFARLGRVPAGLVAHLGVTLAPASPLSFAPKPPYFVSLGTIEPRKNHALLLHVWSQLPEPVPELYIVGARGWADAELLARLDALPAAGPIKVMTGLGDGEVTTLLLGARALLFPSFAEGFGIPALEAAALGTPVVLSDLPVFKELLSHSAVYLAPEASYSWLETIARLTAQDQKHRPVVTPPAWADHFNQVFTLLS